MRALKIANIAIENSLSNIQYGYQKAEFHAVFKAIIEVAKKICPQIFFSSFCKL